MHFSLLALVSSHSVLYQKLRARLLITWNIIKTCNTSYTWIRLFLYTITQNGCCFVRFGSEKNGPKRLLQLQIMITTEYLCKSMENGFIVGMVKLQTHSHLCHLWLSTQLITKQNALIFTQPTKKTYTAYRCYSLSLSISFLLCASHYRVKHITFSPSLRSTGDKILNSKWLYMFRAVRAVFSLSLFASVSTLHFRISFSFA